MTLEEKVISNIVGSVKAALNTISNGRQFVTEDDLKARNKDTSAAQIYQERVSKALEKLSQNEKFTEQQRKEFKDLAVSIAKSPKDFDRGIRTIQRSGGMDGSGGLVLNSSDVHLVDDGIIGPRTDYLISLILGETPNISWDTFKEVTGNAWNWKDYGNDLKKYDSDQYTEYKDGDLPDPNLNGIKTNFGISYTPRGERGKNMFGIDDNPFKNEIIKAANGNIKLAHLIHAVMGTENGWNLDALNRFARGEGRGTKSPKGALGVMQFMPGTAADYGLKDRENPVASIHAAARLLSALLNRYGGDVIKAAAAYNAGPGNVSRNASGDWYMNIRNDENRNYAINTANFFKRLSSSTDQTV